MLALGPGATPAFGGARADQIAQRSVSPATALRNLAHQRTKALGYPFITRTDIKDSKPGIWIGRVPEQRAYPQEVVENQRIRIADAIARPKT